MNWLIVVAGGKGKRMSLGFNKVFAKIGDFPVLYWTLRNFEKSRVIDKIVVSASEEDVGKIQSIVKKYKFKKIKDIIKASFSRQDSTFGVLKTFKSQMKKDDLVGIHNAVNPFVSEGEIREVYSAAKIHGAALLACPAKDTIKISDEKGLVESTPIREYCWQAQTPQVAAFKNLWTAFLKAGKDNFAGTDDAQLLERVGIKPKIVPCSSKNIKVTYDEDLFLAGEILKTFYKRKD